MLLEDICAQVYRSHEGVQLIFRMLAGEPSMYGNYYTIGNRVQALQLKCHSSSCLCAEDWVTPARFRGSAPLHANLSIPKAADAPDPYTLPRDARGPRLGHNAADHLHDTDGPEPGLCDRRPGGIQDIADRHAHRIIIEHALRSAKKVYRSVLRAL